LNFDVSVDFSGTFLFSILLPSSLRLQFSFLSKGAIFYREQAAKKFYYYGISYPKKLSRREFHQLQLFLVVI